MSLVDPFPQPPTVEWPLRPVPPTPRARMRGVALAGNALFLLFIVVLGTWSALAPLESAAIALGDVEAESSRKTIQHLEGGIVREILVRDGESVAAGQVLVRLDGTKARTELRSFFEQYWDGKAREARLVAERDGLNAIAFPPSLTGMRGNAAIATILAGQQRIFETRRQVFEQQANVIRQRIAQVEQEIVGLQAQAEAATKRAAIIREETEAVSTLLAKGLERKPRLLSLQREMVEIDGRRGEAMAQIARARQVISESQVTLLKLESDRQNDVAQALRETQSQTAILAERIHAASDQLARTEIKAPEDGIVTDLRVHTPGGVVAAGEPLLDLVPKEDRLIAVARLRPEDIDVVREGLDAEIHLLPYSQRRAPPLAGTVTYVSADRLTDKRTDQPYYAAKIRLRNPQAARDEGIEIVPGMPVEVFVKTGSSTVALYALRPLLDSFNRSFRED